MSEPIDETYPYSVEVCEVSGFEGRFQWMIRKHGKMHQRSDRHHPSEAKAREQALLIIEKMFSGGDDRVAGLDR